jgi:hypothetical protein
MEKTITMTIADTVEVGNKLIATATDAAGNTSEFSLAYDIVTSVAETEGSNLPKSFGLQQNYPNPFNPETTIKYQLPITAKVTLQIFNLQGRQVVTLINREQAAGVYSLKWDGKDKAGISVSSGIYFYRLQAKNFVQVKKLVLVR